MTPLAFFKMTDRGNQVRREAEADLFQQGLDSKKRMEDEDKKK